MNTIKPEKKNLTTDLLAGLTFALENVPQAIAHVFISKVLPDVKFAWRNLDWSG